MNQIQKQSVLTNEAVNRLSAEAENFLHRLLNVVDHYGCYDARIAILRAYLYPLKLDEATPDLITEWLSECVSAGLIKLYEVNGHPYLEVQGFKRSTNRRTTTIPAPPDDDTCYDPKPATVTIPAANTQALHDYYLQELYKRENARYLNQLAERLRRQEVKQSWVQAFNEHLKQTGRIYNADYEWLRGLMNWLPLNVRGLISIERHNKQAPVAQAEAVTFEAAEVG